MVCNTAIFREGFIPAVAVAMSCNKYWNFIRFILPITLPTPFSGTAMLKFSLTLAGLSKEGFIHLNNPGKGIRGGV